MYRKRILQAATTESIMQVVLYFYPSDNSPGCTKQAAAFTENFDAFKKAGAVGVFLPDLQIFFP